MQRSHFLMNKGKWLSTGNSSRIEIQCSLPLLAFFGAVNALQADAPFCLGRGEQAVENVQQRGGGIGGIVIDYWENHLP